MRACAHPYLAEDAAYRTEDGDCLECADFPPKLIKGRLRGKTGNLNQ